MDLIVTLVLLLTSLATLGAAAAAFGTDSRESDPSTREDHRA
jgi:hypothetical protein